MCGNVVDNSIAVLKLILDWFLTSKMIKKLFTALYGDKHILSFNEGSSNVLFNCNGMGILNIDLKKINLDNNFDEDDPDTIIVIRLLACHIKFEKRKGLKKQLLEDLMRIVRHLKRRWIFFACQKMRKKE